jgi:hypothetical protein
MNGLLNVRVLFHFHFMVRYYPPLLKVILRQNEKGIVMHEISYSWIRGVCLRPVYWDTKKKREIDNLRSMIRERQTAIKKLKLRQRKKKGE